MRLRLVSGLLLSMIIFNTTALAEPCIEHAETYPIGAKAAVVCEMDTGRIIYAYNPNERLAMASTTKIMTALVALEQPNLEEHFVVDSDAIHVEGSSMGLLEGDTVNLMTLVYGMLIPSGNDAANATAVRVAGNVDDYIAMMNERAEELGLENTHYVTPSGLDAEEHYSTAFDMAKLAREAMQNPNFATICSQYDARVYFGKPPYERWLKNHNKLLIQDDRCIGIKTGFTGDAGRCLVSAAKDDSGKEIIVITLNCPDDWTVHKNFYDEYLGKMQMVDQSSTIDGLTVSVVGGVADTVGVESSDKLSIPLLPNEEGKLNHKIHLNNFEYAPIKKGDCLGEIQFFLDDELVLTSNLVASEDVEEKNENKLESIIDRVKGFILKLKGE